MKAIFLSDAHLHNPEDRNYQLLLDFLNQQKQIDALFLLGDIFEFWLGYKHVVFSAYIPLLEKLRQLKNQGTQLYFVEGNHDFNMGPYFTEKLGCTVIPDQKVIEWDSHKICICHGDLLNPDPSYQRLRALWRSLPARILARMIHPDLVWSFAMWLCSKSPKNKSDRSHRDPTPYLISRIDQQSLEDAEIVICGHYHYPVAAQHKGITMIGLGDWISQFSYAEMENGHISLKSYHA